MADETVPVVATRLREAREHTGLRVDQASRRLNWSPLLIEGMEDGSIQPTDGALFQLARLYRCEAGWLKGDTGEGGEPDAAA